MQPLQPDQFPPNRAVIARTGSRRPDSIRSAAAAAAWYGEAFQTNFDRLTELSSGHINHSIHHRGYDGAQARKAAHAQLGTA